MSYSFLKKSYLESLGISDWGYTEESNAKTFHYFQNWVESGDVGVLNYLKDERAQKRKSIKNYYPEFQSALVFMFPYSQTKKNLESKKSKLKLASYVFGFNGEDYHQHLKRKLSILKDEMKKQLPTIEIKFTLDTQPVLERDLAYRSGLGWFGKNSMLISRSEGSYFIIGSLLLNQKLDIHAQNVSVDHCGNCTACLDACPTKAISDNRTIIADKCISTFTIEIFKEAPPPEGYNQSNGEIFGCDICQEVCPWNEKKLKTLKAQNIEGPLIDFFYEREKQVIIEDLEAMTNRSFRKVFSNTPLERTGRLGLLKNLKSLF